MPNQKLRIQFAAAIKDNNLVSVEQLLQSEPLLANADLRDPENRNSFSDGLPLHRACEHNFEALAELLLKLGSHADAPGSDPDDRPVHGMPLHFAAVEHQNYRLAHILLDHGASPNSFPHCDQSTIERLFFRSRGEALPDSMIRRAYAQYLPDRDELESNTAASLLQKVSTETVRLFARMMDLGAQPPFSALVRDGFDDLLMEMVEHCREKAGTPHDYPNSSVLDNISGAARWFGYPKLVRRLMAHHSHEYSYESAIGAIGTAIGSHNRDGDYAAYREIIEMQLDALKNNNDLERAREDATFQPLHHMATDFTWHSNYGYRAAIAGPECYVDLAELFVSWGLGDIEYRDPKSNHSPLSACVQRGTHPGIATYIRWLIGKGADLREFDPDEVNPLAIATAKAKEAKDEHAERLNEILELLKRAAAE